MPNGDRFWDQWDLSYAAPPHGLIRKTARTDWILDRQQYDWFGSFVANGGD